MAAKGASKKSKKGGKAKKSSKSAFKKQKDSGGLPDPADEAAARKRNPRAFVNASRGKTIKLNARKAERDQRRMHVPTVEPVNDEPPPFVVLVHGPPGVGKTTLIRCLVRHYTKHSLGEVRGPVTCVSGKTRRLTFIECRQDLNAMIDAAKFADLVLLLIDASFGFEMETFEFLNLLQSHGFPKVMGVLTHLDGFTDAKRLKNTKKILKHRFWAEIYQGAKLFYLSGIKNGRYLDREVLNLARFIAVTKFRPLTWRIAHPYLVADRFEDITAVDKVKANPQCDRDVAVFGYLRGCNLKPGTRMHIAGAGDFAMTAVSGLPDPCPRPETLRRKALNDRQRLLYAPMADLGGLVYDKDAVYIDIPDWKVQFSGHGQPEGEGEAMLGPPLPGLLLSVCKLTMNS
ncbi:hypothetical protein WJX84_002072 [Apatococcus fuscideae]|uniref:Bms1-type G domain-containing protein n=1 Tax=Apatococcus fuscideae TaxID=2026836 RepID=A0AAW1RIY1_9CHLO